MMETKAGEKKGEEKRIDAWILMRRASRWRESRWEKVLEMMPVDRVMPDPWQDGTYFNHDANIDFKTSLTGWKCFSRDGACSGEVLFSFVCAEILCLSHNRRSSICNVGHVNKWLQESSTLCWKMYLMLMQTRPCVINSKGPFPHVTFWLWWCTCIYLQGVFG